MDDDLWFKRQRFQDALDLVIHEFEFKEKVLLKEITFIRLGQIKSAYTRIEIENKKL